MDHLLGGELVERILQLYRLQGRQRVYIRIKVAKENPWWNKRTRKKDINIHPHSWQKIWSNSKLEYKRIHF